MSWYRERQRFFSSSNGAGFRSFRFKNGVLFVAWNVKYELYLELNISTIDPFHRSTLEYRNRGFVFCKNRCKEIEDFRILSSIVERVFVFTRKHLQQFREFEEFFNSRANEAACYQSSMPKNWHFLCHSSETFWNFVRSQFHKYSINSSPSVIC